MDRWMHPHESDVIIHPSINLTENICVIENTGIIKQRLCEYNFIFPS